ncbi:MAG: hypothetical protein AAFY70_13595, partial [Bacteroidota bacterium]
PEQLMAHNANSQAAGLAELAQVANEPPVTVGKEILLTKKQTSRLLIPCPQTPEVVIIRLINSSQETIFTVFILTFFG